MTIDVTNEVSVAAWPCDLGQVAFVSILLSIQWPQRLSCTTHQPPAAGEFRRAQLPLDGYLASLLDAPLISLLNATFSYRTVMAVASMT
jgi:hypothetical protein